MPQAGAYLIVDGHSIIHAWPELRKHHLVSAKRHLARDELLRRMRHLQDMSGERVIVVFDGIGSRVTEEREPGGLQIFYADAGTTADTVIERLAAKYAGTHRIRVATADGMIRETIHAAGADWLSPEMLKDLCERTEKEMRERIARSGARR